MSEPQKAAQAAPVEQVVEKGLLDQIVEDGRLAKDVTARERGKDLVKEFVAQVLDGSMTVSKDAEAMINARIAQIDHLLSIQLNEILHHAAFQKLEATWRGLKYLVDQSETSDHLKIKIINASKKELLRDLAAGARVRPERALQEGVRGGVRRSSAERRSPGWWAITSSAAGPRISSCSRRSRTWRPPRTRRSSRRHRPIMFNLDSFTQLDAPRDMGKIFDTTEYAKWKSFRQSEDSRYVALTCPRILMRLPYGKETKQVEGFGFEEHVDGSDHNKYLWGNSAFALAARMSNAFALYGWCAAIRGVEGGGLVEGLPVHNFYTDAGDVAMKCPTESPITDRREKELADLGFAPLVHCKGTDYAAFFSVQSCQQAEAVR
jgi:type VI secretion system protein ImpC